MNRLSSFSTLLVTPMIVAFFVIVFLFLALSRGHVIMGKFWGNIGYVGLNSALTNPKTSVIERSKRLFNSALTQDKSNASFNHGSAMLHILQDNEEAALESWATGKIPADYLISFGKNAQAARNYEEAFHWFDRAIKIEPANGDAWYLRGRALAQMGQWESSIENYRYVLDNPAFSLHEASTSQIYCSLGWTYHWLADPPDPNQALQYYLLAVEEDNFSTVKEEADCLYKQAALYFWRLRMPEKAIQSYEAVLQRQPDHVLAATEAVIATYQIDGDYEVAEEELMALIAQFPDEKWGYLRLGDLNSAAGYDEKAIESYRDALLVAPGDTQVNRRLESLTGSESDAK